MNTNQPRLAGVEVEYKQHPSDSVINPEREYYSGMKELNRLLLPVHVGKTLDTLKTIRNLLVGINSKLGNKLGTYGWHTSYGYAFNGLHLHLSHDVDASLLEENILRVIGKWGITPRIATSWHIRTQSSVRSFKRKSKYRPVYVTPRGTIEIRVLDIEYFYDDAILEDIAKAIDYSTHEIHKVVDFGSTKWFYQKCMNEDYGRLLNVMEDNIAPWYRKVGQMKYMNTYTKDVLDFSSLYSSHHQEVNGEMYKDILKSSSSTKELPIAPTKVGNIFNIAAIDSKSDTYMSMKCGSSEFRVPYDVQRRLVKGSLECIPLASALQLPAKVGMKSYSVIPNDAFHYLGINVNSKLELGSQKSLESYIESKLDQLLIPIK